MSAVAAATQPRRMGGALSAAWAFIRYHVLTLYSLLFFAYLMLPIGVVVMFSFNHPSGKFNYVWQGFTWNNWRPSVRSR